MYPSAGITDEVSGSEFSSVSFWDFDQDPNCPPRTALLGRNLACSRH